MEVMTPYKETLTCVANVYSRGSLAVALACIALRIKYYVAKTERQLR